MFVQQIFCLHAVFFQPTNAVNTTFGTLDPPLGEARLRVIEFVSTLFHIRNDQVEDEVVKSGILCVITVRTVVCTC